MQTEWFAVLEANTALEAGFKNLVQTISDEICDRLRLIIKKDKLNFFYKSILYLEVQHNYHTKKDHILHRLKIDKF